MAKKNKNSQVEFIDDEDFSSEDMKTYKPEKNEVEELEVNEEVYSTLEYIELEWPSLSVDAHKSKIIIGTTPIPNEGHPELISIEVENTDFTRLDSQNLHISHSPNKLRVFGKYVFALSDACITRYSLDDRNILEAKGNYGFGLCVNQNFVIVGTMDGYVQIFDHNLRLKNKFKASDMSIECVGFSNELFITGSTDHCLKIFNFEGKELYCIENDSDINCLEANNQILIYGDDNGRIHKLDLNSKEKTIFEWHQTPITFIRWKDSDVFVTGSEEQVCIWDLSLEPLDLTKQSSKDEQEDSSDKSDDSLSNEDTFPDNLLFVHQGEKHYKDCCFIGNKIITTSENGICVFEPVSFSTDLD